MPEIRYIDILFIDGQVIYLMEINVNINLDTTKKGTSDIMIDAKEAREKTDKLFLKRHLEELNGYILGAIDEGCYECYRYYPAKIASSALFQKLVDKLKKKGYEVELSEPDSDNDVRMNISWYE